MKKTKFIEFVEKIEKFKLPTRILMISIVMLVILASVYILSAINSYITLGELNSGRFLEVLSNKQFVKLSIFGISFIISFIFIYINNLVLIKIVKSIGKKENKEIKKLLNKSLALLFSLIAAVSAVELLSDNAVEYLNKTNFLIKDPIFNKDISYYIMERPFISVSMKYIGGYLIATILYLIGYYAAAFGYYFDGIDKKTRKESKWLKHIVGIGGMYLVINIIETFFYKESILFTNLSISQKSLFTKLVGSGFTDINVKLIYFNILPYLMIAFVIVAILLLKNKKFKQIVYIPIIYLIITISTYIIIGVVQTLYVAPNELMLEKKYIQYHLDYTKKAYGIDLQVEEVLLEKKIEKTDLEKYEDVINNLDIIDKNTHISALNKDKEQYHRYTDIDPVMTNLNGKEMLIYLAAKEMASEKLDKADYINRNIRYTYGDGINAYKPDIQTGKIEDITDEYIQKGQKIYYSKATTSDAIVNSSNVYSKEEKYTGTNGLKMTKLNRLNMAIKNIDFNAIVSKYINKNSKYLITRNIIDRVALVFDSMLIDNDPYLVLDKNGKAYYVVDVYTIADDYPYSKAISIDNTKFTVKNTKVDLSKINYIRNSIKVIVDPYDGTLSVYNTDRTDPLAISYAKKYPAIFNRLEEELYQDLKTKFKYPKALMDIQVEILKEYHIKYAETFYKNENPLKLPTYINANNNKKNIDSYYTVTKLQNKAEKEQVLIQPISYSSEDLAGYFIGNVENGVNKISMYSFDKSVKALGMIQLDQQIQVSNDELKESLEDIKKNRNNITKKVMIIPLDNKILYMQVYYSSAMDFVSEPIIEKVVISDGKKICIENSIMSALNKITQDEIEDVEDFLSNEISVNIEQVLKTYKYMQNTLKEGDYEMYGRELKNLDEEIRRLEEVYNKQKKTNEIIKKEAN